jgi:hypothetical protein
LAEHRRDLTRRLARTLGNIGPAVAERTADEALHLLTADVGCLDLPARDHAALARQQL